MRRVAVLLCVAVVAALAAAPVVLGATPTFGKATATAAFLDSITVEQRATLPSDVHRIEAYVRQSGQGRTFLADVPDPGPGDHELRYVHSTPSGSLFPNSRVELGFRVTLDDGTVFDSQPARILYEDTRFAWNTLEGDLVRVHWYAGGDGFGRRALQIGDKAVKEAAELLGVTETDPIDYFIYSDTEAFYDVLGPAIRENVGGIALSEIRTLFANIPPSAVNDPWVGIVVPHELTHLVFATATDNPYHAPPHWMNEGLAVYLSEGYASSARGNVERAARDGEIMPIQALVGQFPTTAERFGLAYDESVSAIDYLIRTYGKDALVGLIRSYAEGVSDDDAFTAALGVTAAGFETGWLADLGVDQPPPAYGPRPAPAGPLPPGWAATPIVPGPSSPPYSNPPGDYGWQNPLEAVVYIGVSVVLLLLLAAGLVVVARNLSRGEPLLPSVGVVGESEPGVEEPDDGEVAEPMGSADGAEDLGDPDALGDADDR